MSTKTTFKRIALVAVAALGLGVLSVVPSQADPISVTLIPSATTAEITTSETATIRIATSAVAGGSSESITVRAVVTSANAATSGAINFEPTTDSTTTRILDGTDTISLDSITVAANQLIRGSVDLHLIKPTAAGTYTVLVYTTTGGVAGATKQTADKEFTWTVTVTAPSKNADSSSTNRMVAGFWTVLADPAVDATVSAAKSASDAVATIKVVQKNATASASEPMVVTVTGPGLLEPNATDTSTVNGVGVRVLTLTAPAVDAIRYIKLRADGATGTSTVTVTGATSGVVIASKTVTFSDTKPASAAATVVKAFIAAGKTTTDVFAVIVKDAAGNNITGAAATVTGTRSDTTTAGKAIATADIACPYNTVGKAYHCTVVGASASRFGLAGYTITATGTDGATPALSTKLTTTASTTFSDIVATKVTVTAPATASVGDKITYTLTATEKNGFPVADTTYEGAFNDEAENQFGGIFWNTTATAVPDYSSASAKPFNSGETITTKSGVATVDIFMPVAAGSVTATWTLAGSATAPVGAIDKSIGGTVVTVSTAIVNPGVDAAADAANEATDAANAATDAALAAADAADAATAAAQDAADAVAALSTRVSTLVSNLRKQITALTKLVQRLL